MSDSSASNPFAAPLAEPGLEEASVLDDSQLLTAAEVECSRMRLWVWVVGILFVGFSLFNLVVFFLVLLQGTPILGVILNLVMISLYAIAAVLVLRCASKLSEFRALPRPFQLEEVLVSHAASWKYVGIVSVTMLTILVLMVLRDVLVMM